jgi:hypothetical protein
MWRKGSSRLMDSGPISLDARFADALELSGVGSIRQPSFPSRKPPMQTYYFDMKDGAPIRDRVGLNFQTDSQAIEHSKKIARRFSHKHPAKDNNLCISCSTSPALNSIGNRFTRPLLSRCARASRNRESRFKNDQIQKPLRPSLWRWL